MKLFSRDDPHMRPLLILAGCILGLALIDVREFLTMATAASTFETFATIGLVALGLGLTMMIREFDLSVVGMYSMAGCIAVVMGGDNAWLGLACALAAGLLGGLAQGFIIVLQARLRRRDTRRAARVRRRRLCGHREPRIALRQHGGGALSQRADRRRVLHPQPRRHRDFPRRCVLVIGLTRYGRDIIATGSDRRAAMTAGVDVDGLIVGIFGFSGLCAALSGALLSYSLASASPSGLSDVIVPAAAAAILGGVSLAGGTGRPLGIAMGVLSWRCCAPVSMPSARRPTSTRSPWVLSS